MSANNLRLSLSVALSVGIVWLVCSLFVWAMPDLTNEFASFMMHMEINKLWRIDIVGVVIGGFLWMTMSFVLVSLSLLFVGLLRGPGNGE